MMRTEALAVAVLGFALLSNACAPGAPSSGASSSGAAQQGPKHIVAAMMGNPPTPVEKMIGGGSGGRIPGINAFEQMLDPGLSILDDKGNRLSILITEVPSVENGLWKVNADGTMETFYKLRPNALWHDGTPISSEDLLFTTKVEQDKDLPIERLVAYTQIRAIDT